MKAVVVPEAGDTDVLRVEEIPLPEVSPSQVLVHVHAAGINPVDHKLRRSGGGGQLQAPFVPGVEFSGTVEAIGEDVQDVELGEAVHGLVSLDGYGAYAQYAAVDADALAPKPASLDHVHAAAVPLAGLTAWQALHDHASLASGERVLVHGGAGGVGHFAIQFARHLGAHVIATGSTPESFELMRELGASEVLDHQREDVVEVIDELDVVLDTVGGLITDRSLLTLGDGGRLVSLIDEPDQRLARDRGVTALKMVTRSDGEQLRGIDELIEAGEVRVVVAETFPLIEVVRAQRRSEEGHVHGKLVLDLTD